jgi:signal transduction histidine kinase
MRARDTQPPSAFHSQDCAPSRREIKLAKLAGLSMTRPVHNGPVTPVSAREPPLYPWGKLTLAGYAVAALSVGTVVLLKETTLSQRVLDGTPLLLAAIGITAWFGGLGPGLFAMLLATVAVDYYFVPPIDTWGLGRKDLTSLAMFVVSALFFVWISTMRRRSEEALSRARDEMEATVAERTADLATANRQLRAENIERQQTEKTLEDLAGRLISAQEEERSRIGRELHDHVSQRLGILAIKIDQLRLNAGDGAALASALDELRAQTIEITGDVHGLSHRLHSSMLDHLGIVPALQRLVKECSSRYAIPITFSHAAAPPNHLPPEAALCIFRVVEESLTNIGKHSQAVQAHVDLTTGDSGSHLSIADQGVGFDPVMLETKAGLGFVSMRERLRLVQGTIRIDSAPSRGTRIEVWVPSRDSGLGVGDPNP